MVFLLKGCLCKYIINIEAGLVPFNLLTFVLLVSALKLSKLKVGSSETVACRKFRIL